MNTYSLPQFEGPLDLLLQLIEDEKVPLSDIALASVTEQFMARLKSLPPEHESELADFLVVATKLLYLKSRLLLPYLQPEETEGKTLAEQLKLYKEYVVASKDIAKLWNRGLMSYGRLEPPIKIEGFFRPLNATATHLERSFEQLLKRLRPPKTLPRMAIDRTVSLREKIDSIYQVLQKVSKITLASIMKDAHSKTEVIVTFLAVLELAKQQRIILRQDICFEEMEVGIAS